MVGPGDLREQDKYCNIFIKCNVFLGGRVNLSKEQIRGALIDHPDPDGQTRKNKTLKKKCSPTHLTYKEIRRFNYFCIAICLYDTFSQDYISLDMTK